MFFVTALMSSIDAAYRFRGGRKRIFRFAIKSLRGLELRSTNPVCETNKRNGKLHSPAGLRPPFAHADHVTETVDELLRGHAGGGGQFG